MGHLIVHRLVEVLLLFILVRSFLWLHPSNLEVFLPQECLQLVIAFLHMLLLLDRVDVPRVKVLACGVGFLHLRQFIPNLNMRRAKILLDIFDYLLVILLLSFLLFQLVHASPSIVWAELVLPQSIVPLLLLRVQPIGILVLLELELVH
mmetsp:Transcript_21553/g.20693  ORF Transcript_21553/g.20693 Transcript_21553/m.20693 type:complete len:149 (+) Transcript_21553:627-1073(+)